MNDVVSAADPNTEFFLIAEVSWPAWGSVSACTPHLDCSFVAVH